MKKIIKKIKNIWNKNKFDILIPLISLVLFIIIFILVGFIRATILLVIINLVYFLIKKIKKDDGKLKKKDKKKKRKKRFKIFLIIILTLFIIGVIGVIGFFAYIVKNAPEFSEEALYVSEPSTILDKDGNEIAKLGTEKRVILDYDEIPEVLIDAIIATEDSRFFKHNGVDWARFIKASIYQLMGRSDAGGASTLTMQVSKNTTTSTEATGIKGIIRKFTDVYVSIFKIERNYTKEQIFAFYANSQYLGRNAYGIEQVSLNYFGKSANELNVAEAAMIAGLFQAPGRYDPYKNPEATEARRQTVLKLMLRHGYISKEEYNIAKEMTVEKIVIPEGEVSSSEVNQYQSFIDVVVDEVKEKTGNNPYTTPMTIYTTLNTDFQDYINDIMNGVTYNWLNDEAQAGIAVLDVKNGSIVAIGGGRNVSAIDTYNYATEINKQIGSTAKPLYDYGPAIEYNHWSSYQILVDEPTTYSDGTAINNWDGGYQGFETMRVALTGSRNIPALKAFKSNDKSNVIEFVTNLGLTPEIYSCNDGYTRNGKYCINDEDATDIVDANKSSLLHEAHAIGGYNGESPLTMAAAYAAFANGGTYNSPHSFTKIVYTEDNKEYENVVESNKAMSEETAYIISNMLVSTAQYAVNKNINGVNYAAKTGTTNFDEDTKSRYNLAYNAVNDLWTIGYNTEYSIGVWYGYNKISSEYYSYVGTSEHTRLFTAVGKKVFTNTQDFTQPDDVVSVELESGCPEATLPSEYTPSDLRITELFIKGYEPTTISTRFSKLDDVSNLKATYSDGKVTLTWDKVANPKINTEEYLKEYYSSVFTNTGYLNSYIQDRLNWNSSYLGTIGYDVYIKDSTGVQKKLDFTSTNKYETKLSKSGEYTFIIKTTYSIFKNNASDGKSVNVKITVNSSDSDEEKTDTDSKSDDKLDDESNDKTKKTQN